MVNLFEDIKTKNILKLVKERDTGSEKGRTTEKMNPKRPTPRHIIIKMAKVKDKEINLKSSKRKAVSCL